MFENVGVDYAGPVYLKYGHPRKPTTVKAYITVFVSMSVKAVHLELVSDLTTDVFITTLRWPIVEKQTRFGVTMAPTLWALLKKSRSSFSSGKNRWFREPYQNFVQHKLLSGSSFQSAVPTLAASGKELLRV